MSPRVSVVMASFNHGAFVAQAIESVLSQSFTDWELVVTDDGSQDDTVAVIRRFDDARIKLRVLPENRGASVATNDAIGRAVGEYVAVLNSDDFFLPGKLERQVSYLDQNPVIGAVFGLPRFVDERGGPFRNKHNPLTGLFTPDNRKRDEWLRHFFYHGNALCHPTVMVRRVCYETVGVFDPLLMQLPDLDFWIRLCSRYEIHVLDEELTAYRILDREQNVSAPSREKLARTAWESAGVLRHYLTLEESDLCAVLAGGAERNADLPIKAELALEAIATKRPGYAPFGLNVLRDLLRDSPEIMSVGRYFRLVGEADPYAAEFFRKEHQWLRRSRVVAALRRWYRYINHYVR